MKFHNVDKEKKKPTMTQKEAIYNSIFSNPRILTLHLS